jgi:hypothetical protein
MTRHLVAAVFTSALVLPAVAAADPINALAALRSQDFGSPAGGGDGTYDPPGGHSGGAAGGGGSIGTPSFTFSGTSSKSGSSAGSTSTPTLTQASGTGSADGGSTSGTGSGGTAYSGGGGSADTSDGGLFGAISGFSLIEGSRFDDPPPSATSYEPSWLTPVGPAGGGTGGFDAGEVVDLGEASFLGAVVASNVEEFVPLAPNLTNEEDQTPTANASEPATLLLLGSGLLWQARRRRAQRQK